MKASDSIKEIAAALSRAQAVMAGAKRDSTNPAYRSKYADLASVWEACREALTKNGIAVVQMTRVSNDDEVIVETRLLHSSGEWIEGELSVPVTKADAHGYGSALTYARRYSLAAAVGVAPEDDDGQAATQARPTARPTAKETLPGAMNGADVNREALNMMTEEEQDYLRSEATEIKKLHAAGTNVYDYVEARHFDAEQKMALWALLPSDVRSAIKRGKPQAALASQA